MLRAPTLPSHLIFSIQEKEIVEMQTTDVAGRVHTAPAKGLYKAANQSRRVRCGWSTSDNKFTIQSAHQLAYIAKESFFARMSPKYVTERRHTAESLAKDRSAFRKAGVRLFAHDVLERMSGELTVKVVKGHSLPRQDSKLLGLLKGASDPYVEVATAFSQSITATKANTAHPEWNESFKLLVMLDGGHPSAEEWNTIHVKCVDNDMKEGTGRRPGILSIAHFSMQGMDDLLGRGDVKLEAAEIADLKRGITVTRAVPLVSPDGTSAGTIDLEIAYAAFQNGDVQGAGPRREEWVEKNMAASAVLSEDDGDVNFGLAWDDVIQQMDPDNEVAFEKVAYLDHVEADTQLWISRNVQTKQLVVAFRASIEEQDWLVNFSCKLVDAPGIASKPGDPIKMHDGFLASWKCVERQVLALLDVLTDGEPEEWTVHATGHSLGGAMATVSSFFIARHSRAGRNYAVDMLTFAGPRVGNSAFAAAWGETLTGLRVVNPRDIVPHLPPREATVKTADAIRSRASGRLDWLLNHFSPDDYHHVVSRVLTLEDRPGSAFNEHEMVVGADVTESVDDIKKLAANMRDASLAPHAETTHRRMLVAASAAAQKAT